MNNFNRDHDGQTRYVDYYFKVSLCFNVLLDTKIRDFADFFTDNFLPRY